MIALLLGILDLVFALLMLLMHFDILTQWRIAFFGAVYWIGKGVIFRGSFLSVLDVIAGLYFLLVLSGVQTPLVFLFLGIMLYKFAVSFMMRG